MHLKPVLLSFQGYQYVNNQLVRNHNSIQLTEALTYIIEDQLNQKHVAIKLMSFVFF